MGDPWPHGQWGMGWAARHSCPGLLACHRGGSPSKLDLGASVGGLWARLVRRRQMQLVGAGAVWTVIRRKFNDGLARARYQKVDSTSGAPSQAPVLSGVPNMTCTATGNVATHNGAMPAAYTIPEVPVPPRGQVPARAPCFWLELTWGGPRTHGGYPALVQGRYPGGRPGAHHSLGRF